MTCCLPHRRPAFRKRRVAAIIVRRAFARPVVCRTVVPPSANAASPLSSFDVPLRDLLSAAPPSYLPQTPRHRYHRSTCLLRDLLSAAQPSCLLQTPRRFHRSTCLLHDLWSAAPSRLPQTPRRRYHRSTCLCATCVLVGRNVPRGHRVYCLPFLQTVYFGGAAFCNLLLRARTTRNFFLR